ncbi:MAG TPA: MdtA/MuxA family multidrug efflux RND transporter periplasmic adaptor subunit [Candidatus Angelobacter sp.]|nr:MdtA/MuxA family multidrug efflux RND transporter periplasmic adaptor subunit [Candidatus Angelobacter sp.]
MLNRSWYRLAGWTGLCALVFVFAGCSNTQNPQAAGGKKGSGGRGGMSVTIPVAVAKAETRDLPVYLSGLGSVDAFNTVMVKSRIDGQLVDIKFREGQQVKKGDLLAVIDPRPYQVALSQAEAMLYKDQSALKDAKLNMERFAGLVKDGVIPQQQYDTQASLVGQLEGAVRADQANVDNQKLNISYTQITAPVSGRMGLRQVDMGNMVHAADANGLVVITQLQPIAVIFTLPEDNLQTVAQHMKNGTLQVEAYSRDDQTKLATGTLLTIDNQIDPQTGTGKLKAVFDNHDNSLWPNQFVNARLLLEVRKNSTVIPAAAVQRGPQGTYVFTVKADKTAEMRPVTVSFSQGNYAAISQGIASGESVVTDGQDKLQPGTPVEIRGGGGGPGQRPASVAESGQ